MTRDGGRFGASVEQPSSARTANAPRSNWLTEEKPPLARRYTGGDQWPRTTSEPTRHGQLGGAAGAGVIPSFASSPRHFLAVRDGVGSAETRPAPAPIHLAFPDTIWTFPGRRRGAFSERAAQNTAARAAATDRHGSGRRRIAPVATARDGFLSGGVTRIDQVPVMPSPHERTDHEILQMFMKRALEN